MNNVHEYLPFQTLVGVALGMANKDLGINRHFIPSEAVLTKIGKTSEGGEA